MTFRGTSSTSRESMDCHRVYPESYRNASFDGLIYVCGKAVLGQGEHPEGVVGCQPGSVTTEKGSISWE